MQASPVCTRSCAGAWLNWSVGLHRLDGGKGVVDQLFGMRQPIRNPGAVPSRLVEGKLGTKHLWHTANEREPLALQKRFRAVMTVEAIQGRLVLEQLKLAGSASHVQVDDPFDLGGELRRQH